MQQHGPNCLPGPIRGTPGWWQELGKVSGSTAAATAVKKKRSRKRSTSPPFVRSELVERVRREIEAGTYDTPEKWEAALDRLLEHLSASANS
jgi:hypothetical protein